MDYEGAHEHLRPRNPLMEAAKEYARRGMSVIPIKGKAQGKDAADAKSPLIQTWKPYQTRRAGEPQIEQWWKKCPNAAVGIVCGPISGVIVLDVDGKEGAASIKGLHIPKTWLARTPRCGWHHFFKWPSALEGMKTTLVGILPKVDVKGRGGYVVASPSVGFNGKPYLWVKDRSPKDCELAETPDWLIELVLAANKPKAKPEVEQTPNEPGWAERVLRDMTEGNRNAGFAKLFGRYNRMGIPIGEAIESLKPKAEQMGFPFEELRQVGEGIYRRYPIPSPSLPPGDGDAEMESEPMEPIALSDLLRTANQEIEWSVVDVIPKEAVGIIAGAPGLGKSWMLLDMAIEAARPDGKWLEQFPVKAKRVLYVDEESSVSLLGRRLARLLQSKGLNSSSMNVHFLVGKCVNFSSRWSMAQFGAVMEALKPDLVIVDSLIRVHRADENAATSMASVFSMVKGFVRKYGCAFVFSDHQRKQSSGDSQAVDQQPRGSSDKGAFVDSLLVVRLQGRGDGFKDLFVEQTKSRHSEQVSSFVVRLEDPKEGGTAIRFIRNAKPTDKSARLSDVCIEIKNFLQGKGQVARLKIVEAMGVKGFHDKLVDDALRAMMDEGLVERENKRATKGPGGKQAYYTTKAADAA